MNANKRTLARTAALSAIAAASASALFFFAGCGNLGEFDDRQVAAQASSHMEQKYGERLDVIAMWEDRSYQLFGYSSCDRVFCEMSDGTQVVVPIKENEGDPIVDNRQAEEIVDEVYEPAIAKAVKDGAAALDASGYDVSGAYINGFLPDLCDLSDNVSVREWEGRTEGESPFFHARYDGDAEAFIEAERETAYFGSLEIHYDITGEDADYENGFPTDVPTTPSWTDEAEGVAADLRGICGDAIYTEISLYQEGYKAGSDAALAVGTELDDDRAGLLGTLLCLRGGDEWKIIDWIPLGHGVWATSDEEGIRLEDGDLMLATASGIGYGEISPETTLHDDYPRTFSEAAFECYEISLSDEKRREIEAAGGDAAEYRWFNALIAYDNSDPACAFPDGVAIDEMSPSIYALDKVIYEEEPVSDEAGANGADELRALNEGGGSDRNANVDEGGNGNGNGNASIAEAPGAYDITGLYQDVRLTNGFQYGRLVVHMDVPSTYVRM